MDTYVITLSQQFPAKHPRKGEPTGFVDKIQEALNYVKYFGIGGMQPTKRAKIHTMRTNWNLWSKRFRKIYEGKACLSLRVWSGKPYASKQVEIARLTKADGIGIQKLHLTDEIDMSGEYGIVESTWELFGIHGDTKVSYKHLAYNDGLSYEDWDAWFEKYDKSKPLAIIHFTKFRYR